MHSEQDPDAAMGGAARPQLSRRSALRMIGTAGATALLSADCLGQAGRPQYRNVVDGTRRGIASDGLRDESRALQAAIDSLSQAGGGELVLRSDAVTMATVGPLVREKVSLDLNGGTLLLRLSETNSTGVRLRSGATVRNGTIVVRSSGRPSLQGAVHAPVMVGPLYGEGGTPSQPSPDEGIGGWTIRDLALVSDKNADAGGGTGIGAAAISIMGGSHDGLIENIRVLDSPYMLGGIFMDWAMVGPIASANDMNANKGAFLARAAYTTHPHNIAVRNVRIGRMTRPLTSAGGSFGVRLSGVYNVDVSDVIIQAATEAGYYHTAGDLGFEYAPEAIKPMACQGIKISDMEVIDASVGYLTWTNSWADNVGRAVDKGYRPIIDPIHPTDMLLQNIRGAERSGSDANYGFRVDHQRGGSFVDCAAHGYRRGFYVDEQVDGVTLVRPISSNSAEHGISVEHPSRPPRNIRILNPVARGNGRNPRGSPAGGILVGRSENVEIVGGHTPLDAVQKRGVWITRDARNARTTGVPGTSVVKE
jgi:hypothetical protein